MALTLDDKPWYFGAIIGAILAALIVWGVQYLFINDIDGKIKGAEGEIAELDKKIEQGRAAERKLPQFREEVRRLELELEKLRRILPSTRNTEEIIKKIKSLVDQGDFGLKRLTFPKLAAVTGGDPYAERPIRGSLDARCPALAMIF